MRGANAPRLPAYVMVPRMVPGTGPAYLGVAHKPFETQADPANPGPFRVPNFNLPQAVTVERVEADTHPGDATRDFVAAVRGLHPPACTFAQAVPSVRLIERAFESARGGGAWLDLG